MNAHIQMPVTTTLPTYDRQLALRQVGDNPLIARELITLLLTELPGQSLALRHALGAGKLAVLKQLTHRMLGSACCCGTPALKDAAHSLQQALDDGSSAAPGALAVIEEAHQRLQDQIMRLMDASSGLA